MVVGGVIVWRPPRFARPRDGHSAVAQENWRRFHHSSGRTIECHDAREEVVSDERERPPAATPPPGEPAGAPREWEAVSPTEVLPRTPPSGPEASASTPTVALGPDDAARMPSPTGRGPLLLRSGDLLCERFLV